MQAVQFTNVRGLFFSTLCICRGVFEFQERENEGYRGLADLECRASTGGTLGSRVLRCRLAGVLQPPNSLQEPPLDCKEVFCAGEAVKSKLTLTFQIYQFDHNFKWLQMENVARKTLVLHCTCSSIGLVTRLAKSLFSTLMALSSPFFALNICLSFILDTRSWRSR